ncbi:MAG: ATP-binding cassette domain-containing protein [Actinomycetales bacterium]
MTGGRSQPAGPSGPDSPVRALARLLRPVLSARQLASATALGALGVGSGVALIGVAAWLIARAWQMPPVLDLTVATVSVRMFGIGRAVFRYTERLSSHSIALDALVRLRTRLYSALADQDPRVALGLRRGDLLARVGSDLEEVADVVVKGLLPFTVAAVVGAVATLASALILPAAGLWLLAALLLAGVASPMLAARAATRAHADAVIARAQISAGVLTHLESLDELRVADALPASRGRLQEWESQREHAVDRAAAPAAWAAGLQHVAVGVGVVGALIAGAPAVQSGRLDKVLYAVICLLPLAAVEACSGLPAAAAQISVAGRAATRVAPLMAGAGTGSAGTGSAGAGAGLGRPGTDNALRDKAGPGNAGLDRAGPDDAGLDNAGPDDAGPDNAGPDDAGLDEAGHDNAGPDNAGPDNAGPDNAGRDNAGPARDRRAHPQSPATPGRAPAKLRATDLKVGWREPLPVPTEITIAAGELVVITGPSGVGKTTLGLTLAGLLEPLSGRITLSGQPLPSLPELARTVNFTAHDAHIFGTTVRENLLVAAPRGCTDAELLRACERSGLDAWLGTRPDGLDTRLTGGGRSLSGGEARRLLLTRALLTGAQVLILDEPTEHLSARGAGVIFDELADLAHGEGLAVLAITHDDSARADRVIRVGDSPT